MDSEKDGKGKNGVQGWKSTKESVMEAGSRKMDVRRWRLLRRKVGKWYIRYSWERKNGVDKDGPNGSFYEGEWKNGIRHGQGNNSNGDVYEGRWKDELYMEGEGEDGKRHGKGKMEYKDGSVLRRRVTSRMGKGKGSTQKW